MRSWSRIIQNLIILVLPLALLGLGLRVVTAHWLVRWEYNKASFPPDPYGLTTAQRIRLAGVCVDYLTTGSGIDLLADLELEGRPAFIERELSHMVDVKRVIGGLWWVGAGAGLIVVAGTAALAARRATRRRAPAALLGGSLLGIGLLVATGLLMLFGWEVFFDGFHALLFPAGTWTFYYSDTLIRLYPERFWMDVGATLVGVLVAGAAIVGVGAFIWGKRE